MSTKKRDYHFDISNQDESMNRCGDIFLPFSFLGLAF